MMFDKKCIGLTIHEFRPILMIVRAPQPLRPMRRVSHVLLAFLAACGGGGGDKVTGPAPVATVTLSAAASTINVGQTTTLTASPKDASGNAVAGKTVVWTSSNTSIATISTAGVVTGVSPGGVVIAATVDTKTAQTSITITQAGPDCTGITPVSMTVGQVRLLSGTERATLCLPSTASASEYALIPVDLSPTLAAATVSLISTNTQLATGLPAVAQVRAVETPVALGPASANSVSSVQSIAGHMPRNVAFERTLRAREREMARSLNAARRSSAALLRRPGKALGPSSIKDLPTSPSFGTLVTLNANANSACTAALNRVGKVVAVSNAAIVVEDTTAPAGGFTAAEYLSIATTFDTLVFSLDTTAFGAPYDMDNNGRVLMFFTTAVNQLTGPSGANGVIGGFFFERDIVPRVANALVPFGCATSNEGEMFYLPVVDANSKYNPFFKSKASLFDEINGTTVHEFQHLINASRRYYVTVEIVDGEESWLNEGMSHIAEELLWYKVTGLVPKTDITFAGSYGQFQNLTLAYQADNMSRYGDYLHAPDSTSPYADGDLLSTRGAIWALLRYCLDQSPNSNRSYLKALVDAPTQGIPNFNNVFASVGGLAGALRSYVVANFTDNAGLGVTAQYTFPSWNFRDWLPHFTANASKFPLTSKSLVSGIPVQLSLVAGGSSIVRFRVAAGSTAGIATTISGAASPASVDLMLVRTQ